jgi:hypothetical protein
MLISYQLVEVEAATKAGAAGWWRTAVVSSYDLMTAIWRRERMMTIQEISADKRLLHKIQSRLAMISLHFKAKENARTERVTLAKDGPPLPFLYQG